MPRTLDNHFRWLHDAHRLEAYERAIRSVVRTDSVVVDLGCGTGVLGLMAARAGARRVYAIERRGIIDTAADIARDNGVADRISYIAGESIDITLPEPADLVMGYQMGPLGFEAGLVQVYADAARRFLRPGGTLIPAAVETWLAPAQSAMVRRLVSRWDQTVHGVDFRRMRRLAANSSCEVDPQDLTALAAGQRVMTLELGVTDALATMTATLAFEFASAGTFDGFCGWFHATLTPGISITSAPIDVNRIARALAFLPVEHPLEVCAGDRLLATISVRPSLRLVEWKGVVERGGRQIGRFNHNTLPGLSLDTLVRRPPPRPSTLIR